MGGNLSQYRIFAVIAETGSISGAARRLYISQPAVSKSISGLESSMGCKLFVRGSRGVQLTEEGEILYRHVSEAFRFLEAGEKELRRYHDLGMGHLSIGASTTLCKYRLLPYLREFVQLYPHISLDIVCEPTIQTLELIRDGRVDIGLVAAQSSMDDIEFCSIGTIKDVFVATPSYLRNLAIRSGDPHLTQYVHYLTGAGPAAGAAKNDPGDPQYASEGYRLLEQSTLMLLNKENATRQYINDFLEERHIHPENTIETTTMDLLIEFARTGLGVAGVIQDFIRDDLETGSLVRIPVDSALASREIGFAWSCGSSVHGALDTFRSFLSSRIRGSGQD